MVTSADGDGRSRVGELTERIRTGARRAFASTPGPAAVTQALEVAPETRRLIPVRYQIKEDDSGRYLTCGEASNITVRIERGLSVSASAARKYARGTIFLDGAAQAEPFLDSAKGVYNLDHHEGCVRAFTLATCEQAMVLILKGLDLDDERWTVWGNDPDFDAVLGVWLLLNHRRIADESSTLRERVMPMVRLQGVIDAHGFELQDLTGFPPGLQERTLETINQLRSQELALKSEGSWGTTDLLEYTRSVLQWIDDTVYTPGDFEGRSDIEELGRVRISPQRIAIACRSESGIYEVEEQLREIHDDRLGLVILQKDASTYTLRQVDPFLPAGLEQLYERLNLLDPSAAGDQRWGGSGDIGGSPRGPGTALRLEEIVDICRWVFRPPTAGRRLAAIGGSFVIAAAVLGLTVAVAGDVAPLAVPGLLVRGDGQVSVDGSLVLLLSALLVTAVARRGRNGFFGWRRPRRYGFLALAPLAALLVVTGGGWLPLPWLGYGGPVVDQKATAVAVLLAGVAGIELLVHGALHGMLVTVFPVMLTRGRRFISAPNLVTAVIYASAVAVCLLPPSWIGSLAGSGSHTAAWLLAALLMGLVCGSARERWGSLWAPVLLHAVSVIIVLAGVSALL